MRIVDLSTHPRKYVTVEELADYLEVGTRTVYHHIEKGALKVIRLRKLIRIPIQNARLYACEPGPLVGSSASGPTSPVPTPPNSPSPAPTAFHASTSTSPLDQH